jgi:adenylate cyclase class 2
MDTIPHEIEVKFYPVDIESLRTKLKNLGASCTHPLRLMKRVLFDCELNPHLNVDFIRVRDEGDCVRLSTKEFNDEKKGIKYQRELDVLVSDFDRTVTILEIAGLKRSLEQESKRETWQLDECDICIDIWPHLKPCIEIEAPSENKLTLTAEKLGFQWADHINGGALLLYMREYKWDKVEAMKYVKRLFFDRPLVRID